MQVITLPELQHDVLRAAITGIREISKDHDIRATIISPHSTIVIRDGKISVITCE